MLLQTLYECVKKCIMLNLSFELFVNLSLNKYYQILSKICIKCHINYDIYGILKVINIKQSRKLN